MHECKLIVALDGSLSEATRLVDTLREHVDGFLIGPRLLATFVAMITCQNGEEATSNFHTIRQFFGRLGGGVVLLGYDHERMVNIGKITKWESAVTLSVQNDATYIVVSELVTDAEHPDLLAILMKKHIHNATKRR